MPLPILDTEPEMSMSFVTRRTFLQTTLATGASLLLPKFLFAERSPKQFWFLHTPTGQSWAVDDPVAWCLANAHQPILEQARKRLITLTSADRERLIRLVTRRCKLNLIEIQGKQVVVHFWSQQGQGDLRPFFKKHGLARKGVEVTLIDRKPETSTVQSGDEFLYGERIFPFWPVEVYCVRAYRKKWQRRFIEESNDWKTAPWSESNYCWEGVERRQIPWRVLKSAWCHETAPLCQNCDQPTVLISFGYFVCGFYKRESRVARICPLCWRMFEDRSPWDGPKWMMENLDPSCLPSYEINLLGKVDKSKLLWTPEGQVYDRNNRAVQCLNRIDGRNFCLCDGQIGLWQKNVRVTLPSFDGPDDQLEEWCREVIRTLLAEK